MTESAHADGARAGVPVRFGLHLWAAVPVALVAAAVGVPWLLAHGSIETAFVVQRGFALACHQQPGRSLWLFGHPLAVCARCFGIYLGCSFGLLLTIVQRSALRLLAIATALNVTDLVSETIGLHGNWIELRFVLGFVFGLAVGLVVTSVARRADCATETPQA